jgi:rod shape-determining protein MreC
MEHRAIVILTVLVLLSLVSLASGKKGSVLSRGVRTVVSTTAYPFLKVLKLCESGYDYASGFVIQYDQARHDAEILRGKLAQAALLAADRAELAVENQRLRRALDFVGAEPRITLKPAAVISRAMGTLTIDRGSAQGVREGMCALTPGGIAGIVSKVGPLNAHVLTLHNADCKIGAMIRRTRVRGIVHGSGSDLSYVCRMEYIDLKDEVRENDEVISIGGGVFPRGYPIGRVTSVRGEGTLLQTAYVEPVADLYSIEEVLLVERELLAATDLTAASPSGQGISLAPTMPDERSPQERYAP